MNREIILVEQVNEYDTSTEKCKAFTNTDEAKEYFKKLVYDYYGDVNDDDMKEAIDKGYYHEYSIHDWRAKIIIKKITFMDE